MWTQRRILRHVLTARSRSSVVSRSFPRFHEIRSTQERLGTKEKLNMAAGSFELVKILFLRQTIDEEIAFGIFSLSKHMFCCLFVSQCKNCAFSRLPNT